jgi:hypothetical protein
MTSSTVESHFAFLAAEAILFETRHVRNSKETKQKKLENFGKISKIILLTLMQADLAMFCKLGE